MPTRLLILGGATEARVLARLSAEAGLDAALSLAGRVERPRAQPLPLRIGGFGGAEGLARHIREAGITHLIDATHPFAAQMSRNAVAAAAETGVSFAALSRPPWRARKGDDWRHVPDIAGAVAALSGPRQRVFLAIGRQNLAAFTAQPQHAYLARVVDPPEGPLPPDCKILTARGPFTASEDRALMEAHEIDLIVSKNSGGDAARAKLDAARALGLPVLMIDRPAPPDRLEFHDPAAAMRWLSHAGTERGV